MSATWILPDDLNPQLNWKRSGPEPDPFDIRYLAEPCNPLTDKFVSQARKRDFAEGITDIKYTYRDAQYMVGYNGDIYIMVKCLPTWESLIPWHSPWVSSQENIDAMRGAELERLSGPFSCLREPGLAWEEIVWNLLHGGCDSVDGIVRGSARHSGFFYRPSEPDIDEAPQELLDFLNDSGTEAAWSDI